MAHPFISSLTGYVVMKVEHLYNQSLEWISNIVSCNTALSAL